MTQPHDVMIVFSRRRAAHKDSDNQWASSNLDSSAISRTIARRRPLGQDESKKKEDEENALYNSAALDLFLSVMVFFVKTSNKNNSEHRSNRLRHNRNS